MFSSWGLRVEITFTFLVLLVSFKIISEKGKCLPFLH